MSYHIERNPDGTARGVHRKPRTKHRVTFGKADWDRGARLAADGSGYINAREVRVDGTRVGMAYGMDPAPGNATRPTRFRFIPDAQPDAFPYFLDERRVLAILHGELGKFAVESERLDSLRRDIERCYPEEETP